jgi:HEAT repeat protein
LKESIISTIEEVGEPGGGPALRLALLDDDEGIATEAARVLAKIGFKPAVPLMIKAVKIRKDHGKPVERFHPAVCKALGVFAIYETMSYLMEQTRKKSLWGSGALPAVREAAARALVHFVQPEASGFLDALLREGDETIRKAVEEERGLLTQVETPAE